MDWRALERAAKTAAGSGGLIDGESMVGLRRRVSSMAADAVTEVGSEADLPLDPMCELLIVDRRSWAAGNVRTLQMLLGDAAIPGSDSPIVSWEGGLFLGVLSRAVLAQYDPYRDLMLVVYPNLGELGDGDGLRWIVFHELTHLAQFRKAPWMRDYIVDLGRQALGSGDLAWMREAARNLASTLPELLAWARRVMAGEADEGLSPVMRMLPDEQREILLRLHSLLTVLEGHATHVTDLISRRLIPDYEALQQRIRERRKRPPLLRLLEGIAGLEMKRQQYLLGRQFCEAVWTRGGPAALEPVWSSPELLPTADELRDHTLWLRRVG